ncbi:hypothetical protein [Flavobacterium subsaxonicum]|uniref:Lipocalin-like domain-containing protein n=1 Tax=Flavobacterium subsaxonicum WB 4.1-42 = DSM 21790 TaxID=1121898 RepID=A0A0A2MN77_9FLAO|nr:hypothetical protein [Flavobacterium subsaxonicum]KGO92933.1 hypothetical protein Q766_09885 [Flavobacterium subsaxonicum WB 4.1-42 = DSM 21790]
MKNFVLLLFASFIMMSCNTKISTADLAKINGYWEIEKVEMPDGTEKDYKVNPTVDFFEVKGTKGFRKKVMPQFDGTYRVNDLSEDFTITDKDGKTFVNYTTTYAKWQEELVKLDDDVLVVKNQHGIEYHYKRPIPFTIK